MSIDDFPWLSLEICGCEYDPFNDDVQVSDFLENVRFWTVYARIKDKDGDRLASAIYDFESLDNARNTAKRLAQIHGIPFDGVIRPRVDTANINSLVEQTLRAEAAEHEQSFHDELSSLGWASPDDVKALRDAIEALHVRDKPRQLSISEHELVDRVVEHVDRHLLKKRSICAKAQQMPHVDEVYVTYETTIDGGVFYEVSDDMPGNRWMKIQYRDLGKLLRDFSGKRMYWVVDE